MLCLHISPVRVIWEVQRNIQFNFIFVSQLYFLLVNYNFIRYQYFYPQSQGYLYNSIIRIFPFNQNQGFLSQLVLGFTFSTLYQHNFVFLWRSILHSLIKLRFFCFFVFFFFFFFFNVLLVGFIVCQFDCNPCIYFPVFLWNLMYMGLVQSW